MNTSGVSDHDVDRSGSSLDRWLAVAEFGAVIALYAADVYGLIPISKTLFLLTLGWISLRLRGKTWASVGLAAPVSWTRATTIGLLAGVALVSLELFVSYPLLTELTGKPPDLSDFRPIVGNVGLLLAALVFIWIVAVLGEELVYRGYLMNRVAGLAGGNRASWLASLFLIGVLFGAGHIDQGLTGMTENVINGLLLGLLYLGCGRNLVAPIVAHGVSNTVDLILIYLGRYPGL